MTCVARYVYLYYNFQLCTLSTTAWINGLCLPGLVSLLGLVVLLTGFGGFTGFAGFAGFGGFTGRVWWVRLQLAITPPYLNWQVLAAAYPVIVSTG